jgi:hypothetical protein
MSDPSGSVCQEALENRGAHARPDQAPGDVRIGRAECVQIGVGLPRLEAQFDLPPESVEPGDEVGGEPCAQHIRTQLRHRPVSARKGDDAEAHEPRSAHEVNVEIQMAPRVLGEDARRSSGGRCRRAAAAIDPDRADPWVVTPREAHDEGAPLLPNRLEVRHARVAAVGQQQTVREGGGFRRKRSFGVAIWRELRGRDLVGKPALGCAEFDGRRLEGMEPTRERLAERRRERKRRPVVHHDGLEARDGALPLGRERLEAQLLDEP